MKDDRAGQPDSPGRRAAAYWFSDGLPETAFGVAYLVFGGLGVVSRLRTPDHWMELTVGAALLGFMILLHGSPKILDSLKARLTYPRTGYVRPPGGDQCAYRFGVVTVWMFFVAMTWVHFWDSRWMVPVLMTIVAVLVYALNRREARPYSWWSVLPLVIAGLASARLDLPPKCRQFLPILIGGAWLLSRGTWTLVHYLRAHPRDAAVEAISHEWDDSESRPGSSGFRRPPRRGLLVQRRAPGDRVRADLSRLGRPGDGLALPRRGLLDLRRHVGGHVRVLCGVR
jgi:hypothetical protein